MLNLLFLLLLAGGGILAQAPAPPVASVTLSGILVDPSDAPVPAIRITLAGGARSWEATTSATGEFRFDNLPAGGYELMCEVPGFDRITRRVRTGPRSSPPLRLRLSIAALKEQLSVSEGDRTVAPQADRNADTIFVERTMLDSLPFLDNNYLSALGRFLDPGTPGGAGTTIVVDGMEMRNAGVTASAMQEIRINNNPYTVEYPRWSRRRNEVITKSSADAYHGTLNFLFRDYHLNARDALAPARPQEQRRIWEGSLFGPVGKSKSKFPPLCRSRRRGPGSGCLRGWTARTNQSEPADTSGEQGGFSSDHPPVQRQIGNVLAVQFPGPLAEQHRRRRHNARRSGRTDPLSGG